MLSSASESQIRVIWITLSVLGSLFMFLPVHIQFIGEESVYAVYLQQILRGGDYLTTFYRPPLFLWVSSVLEQVFGFSSIEIPLRISSILSSIGAAAFAALFAKKVFQQNNAGIITFVLFISMAEIQFWYGWLGYADAMFLFFTFACTVSIWLAAQFQQIRWFALAILFVNCAFFTKALTAYVFFASTLLITAIGFNSWRFFLRPVNLLLALGAMITPLIWMQVQSSDSASSYSLVHDIMIRFSSIDLLAYAKHLFTYPLEFLARMAPVTLIVIWFAVKHRQTIPRDRDITLILIILVLNFLPYWLAPSSNMRHAVPLYGWGILAISWYLLRLGFEAQKLAMIAITFTLLIKVPYSFWGLPQLKAAGEHRDLHAVSENILSITDADIPIRQKDASFIGYALTAYINELRPDTPLILEYRANSDHHVYVLANGTLPDSKVIKEYSLFNYPLYLLYVE